MPPVKKLWTNEERLMTNRAWVSPMDLIEINNELSYKKFMKKMENYRMNPNRSICLNKEDKYGVFIRLMYGKVDTKYTNWDYYQWVLINSLHDDDNTVRYNFLT